MLLQLCAAPLQRADNLYIFFVRRGNGESTSLKIVNYGETPWQLQGQKVDNSLEFSQHSDKAPTKGKALTPKEKTIEKAFSKNCEISLTAVITHGGRLRCVVEGDGAGLVRGVHPGQLRHHPDTLGLHIAASWAREPGL